MDLLKFTHLPTRLTLRGHLDAVESQATRQYFGSVVARGYERAGALVDRGYERTGALVAHRPRVSCLSPACLPEIVWLAVMRFAAISK